MTAQEKPTRSSNVKGGLIAFYVEERDRFYALGLASFFRGFGGFRSFSGFFRRFSGALFAFGLNLRDHHFARFEGDGFVFVHPNFNAGAGVASVASGATFDGENAKVAKFEATRFHQNFDNRIERRLDDFFSFLLRKSGFFGNQTNDFLLGHVIPF